MFPGDAYGWSEQVFGNCDLGDKRRTRRLVDVGARMARQIGSSLSKCCEGDDAALLGSYRLLRNEGVTPEAIREGAFLSTADEAQRHQTLLLLEDTTSVSYEHAVATELGITGSNPKAKKRGYQVHSVLMVDTEHEQTVGLIEQSHWCREAESYGKKHQRKKRAYEDKESYKWEQASTRVAQRLGDTMARTISVCDREADLYDYLSYKLDHKQRFVVRAKVDRLVVGSELSLFEIVEKESIFLCCYRVDVKQRGGRLARRAKLALSSMTLTLKPPQGGPVGRAPLHVNVVVAQEIHAPSGAEPLRWILLTTEPVDSAEQALTAVRYYELRWRIEEYHKAWKSGVGVERQRLQSPENLERMLAITALLAVRLLQLRECQDVSKENESRLCDETLSQDEWKILWITTERSTPPALPPSARWAYLALAKLGGFTDTKRTGRPGWCTMWHGWFRLQERVQGYQLSRQLGGAEL